MAKVIPIGGECCPECNGHGTMIYSCCTGDPLGGGWEDIMMCPVCKEHLGEEDCVTCDGRGWVLSDDDETEELKMQILKPIKDE